MKFFSFIILMFISSSKSSRDDSHNKQLSLGGIPTIDNFQNHDDLAGREKTCEARRTRVVHYCSPSGNLLIDYPTTLEDDVSIPLHRCFMFDALAKDKNVICCQHTCKVLITICFLIRKCLQKRLVKSLNQRQ